MASLAWCSLANKCMCSHIWLTSTPILIDFLYHCGLSACLIYMPGLWAPLATQSLVRNRFSSYLSASHSWNLLLNDTYTYTGLKSLGENMHSGPSSWWHKICSTHRWNKLHRKIFKKEFDESIDGSDQVQGSVIQVHWLVPFMCDQPLISFLLPVFSYLFLPDLPWVSLFPPLTLSLKSPVTDFAPFPRPLLVAHDKCCKVPQGPLKHAKILMLVVFPPSYQLQSSCQLSSRLCLSVFLMGHQSPGKEFCSLLFSLLSPAPQVFVSLCLINHFPCYLLFILYWIVLKQIT